MQKKQERACAVICEYNPFHFGHRYQLSSLKSSFEVVICILGANLTQRGEVAVADRYLRAEAAIRCGADIVLELPLPWCCSSAADFAFGGVSIAERLPVTHLAFSAESNAENLLHAAQLKKDASPLVTELIRQKNLSYPKAMEEICGIPLDNHPNDILGLEYLCRINRLKPFILKRDPSYQSSSSIRSGESISGLIPEEAEEILRKDPSFPRKTDTAGTFLLASLRNGIAKDTYGMTDELYAALSDAAGSNNTLADVITACTSKMFTAARIRRSIWSTVLQIPAELPKSLPPYALLLAANEAGCSYLKANKKNTQIPIVSKPGTLRSNPVFQTNAKANNILRTFFGGSEDAQKKPSIIR